MSCLPIVQSESDGHPLAIAIAPDGTVTNLSSTGMIIGAFAFAMHLEERTVFEEDFSLVEFCL